MDFGPHPDLPYTIHPQPDTYHYLGLRVQPTECGKENIPGNQPDKDVSDSMDSSAASPVDVVQEKEEELPERKPGRFYAAFATLCVVNLVCAIDATIISVALPVISQKLGGSAIEAFWCGTSFLLTSTVFQPSFASLSRVFGRKEMLLLTLTFFTAGSLIAAAANSFTVLLVGRSVQGLGGGGISSLTYVIVTDMVNLKERGKWFGLITMTWAFGSVAGPVLGGVIAEKISWRWIFLINMPCCALGYIMIPLFLTLRQKKGSIIQKCKQNDWIGSILFIGSTTSYLIPITWGGVMYAWTSWRTLVPLCAGVGGIVIFILWSKFFSKEPILRGSMFKSGTALVSYFGTIIQGMVLWSTLFYMPLYFEAAKGYSAALSGVALFPWTFTIAPAAAVTGYIVAVTGRYKWGVWLGWLLTAVGVGLLTLYNESTPAREGIPIALISGVGLGILFSANSFAIQASASNQDLPYAAALYSFFRSFGQMLGVAVGGSIFQNQVKKTLLKYPDLAPRAAELSRDASALVQVIKAIPSTDAALKENLIAAYIGALKTQWLVMTGLAVLALVLGVALTKAKTLERTLETEQGFVNSRKKLPDAES